MVDSMPQARNLKASTDNSSLVRGKASVHSSLTESSFATQKRALKINESEHKRLELTLRIIDKHGRALESKREKIIDRMQNNLKQLGAYQQVLNTEYNADSFDTLTFGYKVKEAKKDPSRFQRFIYETRIYNSGFSMRNLRRQVSKKLIESDPMAIRLKAKQDILDNVRRHNELINHHTIDRKTSLTQIFENHKKGVVTKLPPIKQSDNENEVEDEETEQDYT